MNRDVITHIMRFCPASTIMRYCATCRMAKNDITYIKFDYHNIDWFSVITTKIHNQMFLTGGIAKYIYVCAWNSGNYNLVRDLSIMVKVPFSWIMMLVRKIRTPNETKILLYYVDDKNADKIDGYEYRRRRFMKMAYMILKFGYVNESQLEYDDDILVLLATIYDDFDGSEIDYYTKICNPIYKYICLSKDKSINIGNVLAEYNKINLFNEYGYPVIKQCILRSNNPALIADEFADYDAEVFIRTIFMNGSPENDIYIENYLKIAEDDERLTGIKGKVDAALTQLYLIVDNVVANTIAGDYYEINMELLFKYIKIFEIKITNLRFISYLYSQIHNPVHRNILLYVLSNTNISYKALLGSTPTPIVYRTELGRFAKRAKAVCDYDLVVHIGEYSSWELINENTFKKFKADLIKKSFLKETL